MNRNLPEWGRGGGRTLNLNVFKLRKMFNRNLVESCNGLQSNLDQKFLIFYITYIVQIARYFVNFLLKFLEKYTDVHDFK